MQGYKALVLFPLLGCLLPACADGESAAATLAAEASPVRQAEPDANQPSTADRGIENRGSAAADDSEKWWTALPRDAWAAFEAVSTEQEWFEVYRIADGIYAIYEPGQFEEVISYLILGQDRALLFDTGLGIGDIQRLVQELTDLPITVLNSHTHYDHIGGNHQFREVISRGHPYARQRSRGLTNSEVGEYAQGDWVWKATPAGFDAAGFSSRPWQVSRWIAAGQFIDLGGVSLEVVDSPGHSPDSIVLVDHQRRLMFTGDTFYLAPLYTHIPGGNFEAYAESAARLAQMADTVDSLLMSHNTPTAGSEYLLKLHAAFQAIGENRATFTPVDSGREYRFDGFAILTSDPPVPADGETASQ
jgi:glyoxylase-like metal-dependent hydrolase (beta-lactamase superfamily II)